MPGRKVTPKAVAAAGEAAARVVAAKPSKDPTTATPAISKKAQPKQNKQDAAPKKEVEYVVYKVGAEKPKHAPRKPKKDDLATLNKSVTDSADAKTKRGKNVMKLAPKKQPILPHHHGGKPATKPSVPIHAE